MIGTRGADLHESSTIARLAVWENIVQAGIYWPRGQPATLEFLVCFAWVEPRQRKESLEWSAARTGRTALRFLVTWRSSWMAMGDGRNPAAWIARKATRREPEPFAMRWKPPLASE